MIFCNGDFVISLLRHFTDVSNHSLETLGVIKLLELYQVVLLFSILKVKSVHYMFLIFYEISQKYLVPSSNENDYHKVEW